jgi:hypothetical protein
MHIRNSTPRWLFTFASLSALAAATVYCSSSDTQSSPNADTGSPGADGSTPQSGDDDGTNPNDAGTTPDGNPPRMDAGAGTKPNILFFLTDDLSWNLIPHMPNVQALQKKGITFSHYFVTESLCCPSRSSIFTGKYPHGTGVLANSGVQGGYAAFEDGGNAFTTYATALAAQGYHEKMMGKYLNGYDPQTNDKDPGWTDWAVAGNGYPEYHYYRNEHGKSTKTRVGPIGPSRGMGIPNITII